MKKLRFLLVVPVAALAWAGAALLRPAPLVAATLPAAQAVAKAQGRIGTITWQGNKFLTTAQLNEALGLKSGDPYSKEGVELRLNSHPNGQDITSRYMDNGYLFFNINPLSKLQPDGTTDLTFAISEGPVMRVSPLIIIGGNARTNYAELNDRLPLKPGNLFSRAKLIQSQRILAESGLFDPTKIMVNLDPKAEKGEVSVMFKVTLK